MIAGPADPRWAPPGDWKQVTIFLSPLDVHINRTPVDGRVTRDRVPSGQLPAGLSTKTRAQNELNEIWIDQQRRARSSCGRSSASWPGGSSAASHEGQRVDTRRAHRTDEVRIAHGRVPADARRARRRGRPDGRRRRDGARQAARDRPVLETRCAGGAEDRPRALQARRLPAAVAVHGRQPVLRLRLRRLLDARRLRHGGACSSASRWCSTRSTDSSRG